MGILSDLAARLPPEPDVDEAAPTPRGSPLLTDAQKAWLCWYMRRAGAMFTAMHDRPGSLPSGSDRAEAEVHACERRVYVAVWEGGDLEDAIATEEKRWRAHAAEMQRRVDAAPKLRRGPSSGTSAAIYLWVNPEKFSDAATLRIRHNVNHALAQTTNPTT